MKNTFTDNIKAAINATRRLNMTAPSLYSIPTVSTAKRTDISLVRTHYRRMSISKGKEVGSKESDKVRISEYNVRRSPEGDAQTVSQKLRHAIWEKNRAALKREVHRVKATTISLCANSVSRVRPTINLNRDLSNCQMLWIDRT
jgi:hypothetical protein